MKGRPLSKDEGFLLYRAAPAGRFCAVYADSLLGEGCGEDHLGKNEEEQDGRTY